jgi:hypothetical protein
MDSTFCISESSNQTLKKNYLEGEGEGAIFILESRLGDRFSFHVSLEVEVCNGRHASTTGPPFIRDRWIDATGALLL